MPTFYQSTHASGIAVPANPDCAGEVIRQRGVISLPSGITLNDRLEFCILPASCTVFDAILVSDDLDSTTTFQLDVGLMSGDPGVPDITRTVGTELWSASTLPQTGGVSRLSLLTGFRITPVPYDRSIGGLVKVAPTGSAGNIELHLFYGNP